MGERTIRGHDQIEWALLPLVCVVERIGVRQSAKRLGWPAARVSRRMRSPKTLTLGELVELSRAFGTEITIADPVEALVGDRRVKWGRPPRTTPPTGRPSPS